jgi:hypothetical protein
MGGEVIAPPLLTLVLDGGECQPNTLVALPSRNEALILIGLQADGPLSSLDAMEKTNMLACQESNPSHPTYNRSLY